MKKTIKQAFYPFEHVNFQQGKNSEFLPKCCKFALFALQFSKFFGGACPRTPLEKFRLKRLLCLSPRKILLFHKISMEALKNSLLLLLTVKVLGHIVTNNI